MFKNSALTDLALWLVERSREPANLPLLFEGFCGQLAAAGLDLCRVLLGLETLHPELSGTMLLWQGGALEKVTTQRAGILTSESYLRSPTRVVDETGQPFRWRAGESTREMPRLEAYAAEGVTDYLMLPLPFLDTTRTAVIGYATKRSGGFSAADLDLLDAAARMLSPWAERAILRKISLDLLAAYLGAEAGRRVYDGQIERGDLRTIRAALWFCDLRGFTALSDRLPRAKLIKVLNRWFEAMGAAIAEGGGEILKFMGDGLLAVFPVNGDPAATCDRALAAVHAALAADAGAGGPAGGPWRGAAALWAGAASGRCRVRQYRHLDQARLHRDRPRGQHGQPFGGPDQGARPLRGGFGRVRRRRHHAAPATRPAPPARDRRARLRLRAAGIRVRRSTATAIQRLRGLAGVIRAGQLADWQLEPEGRALAGLRAEVEAPLMALDQALGDMQAETGAPLAAAVRAVRLGKALEDPVTERLRDAGTAILDLDPRPAVALLHADADCGPRWRELDSVAHEGRERLSQPGAVRMDHGAVHGRDSSCSCTRCLAA